LTDDDLIRLVEEKQPEDLSLEEIAALRRRVAESPALREALAGQLRLEGCLGARVGGARVSVEEIYQSAASARARTLRLRLAGVCVVAALAGGAALLIAWGRGHGDAPSSAGDGRERESTALRAASHPDALVAASAPAPSSPSGPSASAAPASGAESSSTGAVSTGSAAPPDAQVGDSGSAKESALRVAPPAGVPWAELFDSGSPLSFAPACFDDFAPSAAPDLEALRRWFEVLPGKGRGLFAERSTGTAGFEGLLRLKAPWPADAVLRLGWRDPRGLRLHFLNGDGGTTFAYDEKVESWTAHAASERRSPGPPETAGLLGSDGGRFRGWPTNVFEVRFQEGSLVLTQGDVRVLAAAVDAPPEDVLVEGFARLRGIRMYRGGPVPDDPLPPRSTVLDGRPPAELPWTTELSSGAAFERLDGGAVELTAAPETALATAVVRLPARDGIEPRAGELPPAAVQSPGLFEFLFEVDTLSPGSGIALVDLAGRSLWRFGCVTVPGSPLPRWGFLDPENREAGPRALRGANLQLAPARRWWFRLFAGPLGASVATSPDGRNWRSLLTAPAETGFCRPCGGAGIFVVQGKAPREVRLRGLHVRELGGLASLAPRDVWAKARAALAAQVQAATPAAWSCTVAERLPQGVSPRLWWRAAAVETLSRGPERELALFLLGALVEDLGADAVPPDPLLCQKRLDAIEDLALLAARAEDQEIERKLERGYRELARDLASIARSSSFTTPFITFWPRLVVASPLGPKALEEHFHSLGRQEVLDAVYARSWDDVARATRVLGFWARSRAGAGGTQARKEDDMERWLDWALAAGGHASPDDEETPRVSGTRRHPVVEEHNKEGFNVLVEVAAAVEEEMFADACQALAAAPAESAADLVLDGKDPRLSLSLAVAVSEVMRESDELRGSMAEVLGAVGEGRLEEAIARADERSIRGVTLQFCGTEAAVRAHLWLGDRALWRGQALKAFGHYQEALGSAADEGRVGATARLRLASALLGRDGGEAEEGLVDLGAMRIEAVDLDSLITRLLEERGGEARKVEDSGSRSSALRSEPRGGTRLRPLVVAGRAISRTAEGARAVLGCESLDRGEALWKTSRETGDVISDPLWADGEVLALTSRMDPSGMRQVDLTAFHAGTGKARRQTPLFKVDRLWDRDLEAQVTLSDDSIVGSAAAAVFCASLDGSLRWLRRQEWVPRDLVRALPVILHEPPLVDGDLVYVVQPGVLSVECLRRATGRLEWQRVVPQVSQLGVVAQDRVVVAADRGFVELSTVDGRMLGCGEDRYWSSARDPLRRALAPADGGAGGGARVVDVLAADAGSSFVAKPPLSAAWSAVGHGNDSGTSTVTALFPGWMPLAAPAGEAVLAVNAEGREAFLRTRAAKDAPCVFVGGAGPQAAGTRRLRVAVRAVQEPPSRLEVRAAGKVFLDEVVSPRGGGAWTELDVELGSAPRGGLVEVLHHSTGGGTAALEWRRLEFEDVVSETR
jgi:hypothetical protein